MKLKKEIFLDRTVSKRILRYVDITFDEFLENAKESLNEEEIKKTILINSDLIIQKILSKENVITEKEIEILIQNDKTCLGYFSIASLKKIQVSRDFFIDNIEIFQPYIEKFSVSRNPFLKDKDFILFKDLMEDKTKNGISKEEIYKRNFSYSIKSRKNIDKEIVKTNLSSFNWFNIFLEEKNVDKEVLYQINSDLSCLIKKIFFNQAYSSSDFLDWIRTKSILKLVNCDSIKYEDKDFIFNVFSPENLCHLDLTGEGLLFVSLNRERIEKLFLSRNIFNSLILQSKCLNNRTILISFWAMENKDLFFSLLEKRPKKTFVSFCNDNFLIKDFENLNRKDLINAFNNDLIDINKIVEVKKEN